MASSTEPVEPAASVKARSGGLSLQTFSAFGSRPFRLLWLNTFSFMIVNGVQRFAFLWLALEISDRSIVLGAVSFALGAPILLFSLPAGVLIDRLDRRLVLFGSQIFGLVGSLLAAVLIWAGAMSIGLALAFAFVLGAAVAIGQPARQAIVPTIVEPRRLMNAITLTSTSQNLSQLAGPAIGGVSIAIWGIGGSFAVQAVVLAVGLLALIPLHLPAVTTQAATLKRRWLTDLAGGLRFVAETPNIRALMILLVVSALLAGGPWGTLLPKLAKDELGADALGTSMLFATMGVGTLVASLALASIGQLKNAGGWFMFALIIASAMMVGLGLIKVYAIVLGLMFITGISAGCFMNLNQTLIQAHSPHVFMGRVMSIYTLCFMGGMPLGGLLAGFGAEFVGAPTYFAACGVANVVATTTALVTQRSMRRMSTVPSESAQPAPAAANVPA